MENWRKFLDPNDNIILENQVKNSKIVLNSGQSTSFAQLLENYDNKKVTADRLIEVVYRDFHNTHMQLINEGVLDLVASAYESVKDGAIKLKDNISQKVFNAIAFVNEKYLEMVTKVYMMIQKGPELAARAAGVISKILNAIRSFKEKHPILYKVVLFTLCCIAIAALIVVFSSPAHADIVNQSGDALNDPSYKAIRGLLVDKFMQSSDIQETQQLADAIMQLKKAHESTDQIPLESMQSANRAAYDVIQQLIAEMKQANAAGAPPSENVAFQTLQHFGKIAEGTLTIDGVSI
tara:strand:+ start:249 stop:1127 length:879 start_codon:yes stop_codon:yes gene_type:complete